jgi:hypothetical protein
MKSPLALRPLSIALVLVVDAMTSGPCLGFRPPPSPIIASPTTTIAGRSSVITHFPAASSPPRASAGGDDRGLDDQLANANNPRLTRRQIGELAIASSGLGLSYFGTREYAPQDYGLWGILPVGTYKSKKTIMETIIPDTMWTFDQKFGILNVQVPLRMTVIRLDGGGGLFVYDPIAATPELVGYVRDLERLHGPVRHVVLGSVAIEHKVYAGVFAQKFSNARVWVQPGQYSFPSNLPLPYLGFPRGRTSVIPSSMNDMPSDWEGVFEYRTLGPLISKDGAFGETVFYHIPTRTLLVTDTVLEVTNDVPRIFEEDPNPLLFHARSTVNEVVEDTREVRERGWRRVVLFGLFFTPGALRIKDV